MLSVPQGMAVIIVWLRLALIYISAWASALLVLTKPGNARALMGGTS